MGSCHFHISLKYYLEAIFIENRGKHFKLHIMDSIIEFSIQKVKALFAGEITLEVGT